jgi:hypothetical protein
VMERELAALRSGAGQVLHARQALPPSRHPCRCRRGEQ